MSETALVPQNGTHDIVSQFGTQSGFELLQRQASMLANSYMVPEPFSIFDKDKKIKIPEQQKFAIANAVIAIEMAMRIGASPLMVAQNLIPIYGRPSWSSQFVIAAINSSGKFSPLRFDVTGEGDARTCTAWTLEKKTGDRLEGPPVSIGMAKKEGWYGKNGSKWQTMPELMLRYRAAAFFGRLYAPDILMGMRSVDEAYDIGDEVIDVQAIENEQKIADLNAEIKQAKKAAKENPAVKVEEKAIEPSTPPVVEEKVPETTPEQPAEDKAKEEIIPAKIRAEMNEIASKTTLEEVDAWAYKHHKRLEKQYGEKWVKLLMHQAESRRCFLRGEVGPGEEVRGVVVDPGQAQPETGEVVKCPEAEGREILKSDCELAECHHMCPAFNA